MNQQQANAANNTFTIAPSTTPPLIAAFFVERFALFRYFCNPLK